MEGSFKSSESATKTKRAQGEQALSFSGRKRRAEHGLSVFVQTNCRDCSAYQSIDRGKTGNSNKRRTRDRRKERSQEDARCLFAQSSLVGQTNPAQTQLRCINKRQRARTRPKETFFLRRICQSNHWLFRSIRTLGCHFFWQGLFYFASIPSHILRIRTERYSSKRRSDF